MVINVVVSDGSSFDLESIKIDDSQNHASLDFKTMIKQSLGLTSPLVS